MSPTGVTANSQRPYSTKRRIKTCSGYCFVTSLEVRDHIPQKEGLRPKTYALSVVKAFVRDHIPQKEGLRQPIGPPSEPIRFVRDHIPQKEGLRLQ